LRISLSFLFDSLFFFKFTTSGDCGECVNKELLSEGVSEEYVDLESRSSFEEFCCEEY
jgi:hypothetical protein